MIDSNILKVIDKVVMAVEFPGDSTQVARNVMAGQPAGIDPLTDALIARLVRVYEEAGSLEALWMEAERLTTMMNQIRYQMFSLYQGRQA